jgi:hypothetical protein
MWKSFVLELHGEWSEFTDECNQGVGRNSLQPALAILRLNAQIFGGAGRDRTDE